MNAWMPLTAFVMAHGCLLILPLAVVEGPVVSVVAGLLAARGDLDWFWGLAMLYSGDLIGDAMYYAIGRLGSLPLARLGVSRRFSPALHERLRGNTAKMLVIGKWTHSIGVVVLIGAGMLRVQFGKYLLVNTIATLPKSTLLFALGYFAWTWWAVIDRHLLLGLMLLSLLGSVAIGLVLRRGAPLRGVWARR